MAVLIPINSPFVLTNAPPLFPGLTAASVCMNDSIGNLLPLSPIILMLLPFADTIPAVTVDVKLKGLPTAHTHSPIFTSSELPYTIKGKFCASIFNKAKSVFGSVPITLPL